MKNVFRAFNILVLVITLTIPMLSNVFAEGEGSAKIVKTIDITAAGKGLRMINGDLNADGRIDMLFFSGTYIDTKITNHPYVPYQIQSMTAYDVDGNMLWKKGEADPRVPLLLTDAPIQIYDIDRDGENEVLCVMDHKFTIVNGKTGEIEKTHDLPLSKVTGNPKFDWDPIRCHAEIIIANLTGTPHPQDIILIDKYYQMWAFDKDFKPLWEWESKDVSMGHYPWPYDFDGDGIDEIMCGTTMLGADGKARWTAKDDITAHVDCYYVAELDGNEENGKEIVLAGFENKDKKGITVAYTNTGEELWRSDVANESQQVLIDDYNLEHPGLEIYGIDRIDRSKKGYDGLFLLGTDGVIMNKETPPNYNGWGTVINSIDNWDGTNTPYVLARRRGGKTLPALYDGNFSKVATMSKEGNTMIADFGGDSKQEIASFYDNSGIVYIFANGETDLSKGVSGVPLRQTKRLYNYSRYGSGEVPSDFYGYVKIMNNKSGKVLDISADGANVIQATDEGKPSQLWSIKRIGDQYAIINMQNGMVLDINNNSIKSGENVVAKAQNGDNSQLWNIERMGKVYEISNRNSSKVLDFNENDIALQNDDIEAQSQRWAIKKVKDNAMEPKLEKSVGLLLDNSKAYFRNMLMNIDSTSADVKPVVVDGRTVVPVRFISECFGANVKWDAETSIASISIGKYQIEVKAGSDSITVNGEERKLDVGARLINGRLFVPMRAFAEAIGKKVFWDERGLIIIGDVNVSKDADKAGIDAMLKYIKGE